MKVKVKYSIRMKLTILLLCLTAGMFLANLFINRFFLADYYLNNKERNLLKGYSSIDEIIGNSENISEDDSNSIAKICEKYGITLIIVDNSDYIIFQYGNGMILRERLQQINFGFNPEDYKLIKRTDSYLLHGYNLNSSGGNGYLEVSGFYNKNMIFLMRMAVESINESVNISMKFFITIGIIIMIIGSIVAFIISGEFTKPILKLTGISKQMSDLNFNVKYEVQSNDEIGVLGNSINELSDKLETTIIELKQANYQLKADIEKKEKIDEMRKEFISNVSHELKTPIALIQGYAEGLNECVADDDESREFYCSVIIDEAQKMNKMVKSLLSLTQMEFGNSMLQFEKFDIESVIEGVVRTLEFMIKQNDIRLINNVNKDIFVYADEYKIEEVISNYIVNAIHYARVEKKVIISEQKIGNRLRVSVFNTGDIIPVEEHDRIWEKFYKVDKARTREYGGTGIGLSIVRATIKAHNTDCGIINHENGVEFWFEVETELI